MVSDEYLTISIISTYRIRETCAAREQAAEGGIQQMLGFVYIGLSTYFWSRIWPGLWASEKGMF